VQGVTHGCWLFAAAGVGHSCDRGARRKGWRAANHQLKIQELTMFKRTAIAAIGVVLTMQVLPLEAAPYYGYDGRHYGEAKTAPDYGRSEESDKRRQAKHRGGGSRRGLTPAALALLEKIESKFGPVSVISGYRPGARIAGSGRVSRHASGNAIDFEAGSRKGAIVTWLIANHHSGGTMTYGGMSHIHADIGPHFVSLGSGSGRSGYKRSRSRTAQRYNGRSTRYASRSARGYRDARRDVGYGGNGTGYARRSNGTSFASGYAAIYR
jgi:hypothetical protein